MTNDEPTKIDEMCNRIASETGDMMRHLRKATVEDLPSAQANSLCGAPERARRAERVNSRNGC